MYITEWNQGCDTIMVCLVRNEFKLSHGYDYVSCDIYHNKCYIPKQYIKPYAGTTGKYFGIGEVQSISTLKSKSLSELRS